MCNRFVQKGREVRPQQKATVLLKGPGGLFELPFEAVFGGPARNESRNYWIKREGAEPVIVPEIERFGEKDKTTGQQNWEDAPAGSALEGLLLPTPPGKDYRLLKVVTQAATADQLARLGNDRAPVLRSPSPQSITLQDLSDNPSFQGLFQFNFEEALAKRLGKAVDMRFTEKADFSFSNSGDPLSGRFHGTVDSPDGPGGETTGTFRLHLPNGLDRRDAARLLDHASLEISIETVPERFR